MESDPEFPIDKLKMATKKKPFVLLSCGSFSPITFMHLRLFPMASEYLSTLPDYEFLGGYLSPVADAYGKKGLASTKDRLAMCKIACDSNKYLMLSSWESKKSEWTPTRHVLDYVQNQVNKHQPPGSPSVQVFLLCGADLLDSFNTPGLWSQEDLEAVCGHGVCCVSREGTDTQSVINSNPLLEKFYKEGKIHCVPTAVTNNISSTLIRSAICAGKDIQYLTPDPVVAYIHENKLFLPPQSNL